MNTSSIFGLNGYLGWSLYLAPKHAVTGMTKAAALDHAKRNIRVNAVGPGPVRRLPEEGTDRRYGRAMRQRHEKTVPFLCTGNYYRSRLAEVLFNSLAGKMGLPWRASSGGLALERGVHNVGPTAGSTAKALEAPR